jgi:anti-sigma regulatory factor (Ser/Thr protein kinase)
MRSGAAAGHEGMFHEAAFYDSDEEFLALVIPFLLGGLDAGEPTFTVFPETRTALIRDALPDPSQVTLLNGDEHNQRPGVTIRQYGDLAAELMATGAQQIRVAGTLPSPNLAVAWHGWARYEAAVNRVFANTPLWGLCAYDTRITPYHVLSDLSKTHPWVATPDGHHTVNANYQDPAEFLDDKLGVRLEQPESTDPVLELIDPAPSVARVAVRGAALAGALVREDVENLVTATEEAVLNALLHGRRPVRLRLWVGLQRTVVTVSDCGRGPSDPFAGLLPASESSPGGFGLWLIHQLCQQVTMSRDEQGFTIRMVGGRPY